MRLPEIDFDQIRPVGGTGKREGFEQFVCELAADDAPSADARFTRLHGAGGDGGVECFWTLADGTEHGWQAKYWTAIDQVDKAQLDASVQTALNVHPKLTKYTIAIPVDPTGPTCRSGKSLLERIEEEGGWRDGWNTMAAERGMTVEFQLEWRTSLITRLQRADISGVRTRYWFDADLLPPAWWRARLAEAIAAARPRYIPELTVPVPAANAIAALCSDPGWTEPLDRQAAALEECLSDLRRDAEEALGADMGLVAAACQPLTDALAALRDHPNPATLPQLMEALDSARATVTEQERRETQAMTDKHGNGWDTVGWRQFQAEYQTSFPAAAVDALRKLERQLDELTTFAAGPLLQVAGTAAMLLTGAAGTGKTFVGCDTVRRRLDAGRPSAFLHGRWFGADDPLTQLRDRLQLPPDLTGEEALGVLDQAGRTAGATVLVMIDALNETVPRRMWRDHLDRIIPLIARFEHLRLVLAVRAAYRTQVIPDQLELPSFDHQGFEGLEYEAVAEYADYYNLEPPTSPPLQGEFSNPLFLRLLCEALRSGGRLSLDHAGMGLPELTRLLLEAKNHTISDRLGAAEADQIVHRAMSAIALALGEGDVPWLERSTARQVVGEIWPDQTVEGSLLEALLAEGLLAEDIVDVAGSPTNVILVAFERLGHHLVVAERIKGLATVEELRAALDGGPLRTLLGLDGPIDYGLLEALSVAAAERYGIELVELNDTIGDEIAVLGSVVAGLPWRNPANITPATSDSVKAALAHPETFPEAMEMVFRLATKPDHPLNADWLHDLFAPLSMPDRDALLIPWLYDTYDSSGAVDRLVRWARERDLASVSDATCRLWVTALVWCTGCSDRRVRDAATVAAARLLARHPDQAPTLLQRFLPIDDDWVQQRALDIAYTALLRAGTNRDWEAAAAVVAELVFAEPPSANAAIRDAGRSLLEAAHDRNALPNGIDPSRFRPPWSTGPQAPARCGSVRTRAGRGAR
jgi:hypothetical protein